jgi:hypothetical protein
VKTVFIFLREFEEAFLAAKRATLASPIKGSFPGILFDKV